MSPRRVFLSIAACAALSLPSRQAEGGPEERTTTARDLAVEGRSAFAAGDYARARDLFHRAHELVGAPTLSVYEARALVQLGRLVEASAIYRRTAAETLDARAPEQFRKAVADAERELAALEPRLPTVTVTVRGASADDPNVEVRVDGARTEPATLERPLPLDPGRHEIALFVQQRAADVRTLTLAEGEHPSIVLGGVPARVAPPPREARSAPPRSVHDGGHTWPRTVAYVSIGLGGAGVVTGIVAGVLASSKHSDAEHECPSNRCAPGSAGARDADAFRDLRLVSTVGYAVGFAALAGGVTLFFLAPRRAEASKATALGVFTDGQRAGVRGTF